jgi:hypothetical protein
VIVIKEYHADIVIKFLVLDAISASNDAGRKRRKR